ncbi:MAG: hypothetical protein EZS28_052349, partial [Streblomastix strix]
MESQDRKHESYRSRSWSCDRMPGDGADDGGYSISDASGEYECNASDKHACGEYLFREIGRSVG